MSSAPSNRLTRDRGWARGGQESAGASGGCAGLCGRAGPVPAALRGAVPGPGAAGPVSAPALLFQQCPAARSYRQSTESLLHFSSVPRALPRPARAARAAEISFLPFVSLGAALLLLPRKSYFPRSGADVRARLQAVSVTGGAVSRRSGGVAADGMAPAAPRGRRWDRRGPVVTGGE